MIELFRWVTGQLSKENYKVLRSRLSGLCKKNVQFIRELQFDIPSGPDSKEEFHIELDRFDGENAYLIKTRHGNGCLMQSVEQVSREEFELIIQGDFDKLKESENDLQRELAWHMELDNYNIKGITEYIREKYVKEDTFEEFTIKSFMVEIQEGAERFFDNDLTALGNIDYDMKQLTYMKKIHMPVLAENAG